MSTSHVGSRAVVREQKTSRETAASKIASLLEEHMSETGLSEKQKNQRVKKFGARVDDAIRRSSK